MKSEFAIGILSGLRTFTPPALISRAAHHDGFDLNCSALAFLASGKSANILFVLAAGELIADKLPITPSRVTPGPLLARLASGGLCGAALSTARHRSAVAGAIAGAFGALAGSFAGYALRKRITHDQIRHIPDFPIALLEDSIAVGGSLWLLHRHARERTKSQFRAQDAALIHQEAVYAAID